LFLWGAISDCTLQRRHEIQKHALIVPVLAELAFVPAERACIAVAAAHRRHSAHVQVLVAAAGPLAEHAVLLGQPAEHEVVPVGPISGCA
jgi:hypothetical protein